jgi:membrane complex biogenesis BtpA family protein
MNTSFVSLFSVPKPIIGMVHLGKLAGQEGFVSEAAVVDIARRDILAWQDGGISGLILENWQEDAIGATIPKERIGSMERVCQALTEWITVPFGINILNNDYDAAFRIAKSIGASFVQLDVLVDIVRSDFTYNDAAKRHPFVVDVNVQDLRQSAKTYGVSGIPIIAGIHPKHYQLVDASKTIEQSAIQAEQYGVGGIVLTKATGVAPVFDMVAKVRHVVSTPIGIGSGLTDTNASALLSHADFAIVGTFAKVDGITDNPVDIVRVKRLMGVVYDIQKEAL